MMKCDEIQPLQGAYLDSELDARTTLEIEEHLKSCPECARLFAEEQNFEAWIRSRLKKGQRSASVWERTERAVMAAAQAPKRSETSGRVARREQPPIFAAFAARMRAAWTRLPRAWAGIAVAWMVILALNLATRETGNMPLTQQAAPSASEMRFALKQKQLLLSELAATTEASPAAKMRTAPPSPRSQRTERNLKS
jgi:anti-sigma factor RsiW